MSHSSCILGIDPGYERCGFGVIQGRKQPHILTHGVIKTPAGIPFELRLKEIAQDLDAIIERYQPTVLALEELFFAKSTTTALKVAEARGVIQLAAACAGIEVISVKPNEVKMALTGYGRADKKQVQEMVKSVFGLQEVPKPDDAADALAVAWTAMNYLGR